MFNRQTYKPPQKWSGRDDEGVRMHQTIRLVDLRRGAIKHEGTKTIALIGFACDEGVRRNQGRTGAAEGPAFFRRTLGNFPGGIEIYDFGDIICNDGDLEVCQKVLAEAVSIAIRGNFVPLVVGGGHELAWGHYQGLVKEKGPAIGIINVDAHFDLRPLLEEGKGSSGTSFTQISEDCKAKGIPFSYLCLGIQKKGNTQNLFQRADERQVKYILAEELLKNSVHVEEMVDQFLNGNEKIYLTICLDVFAAPFAPGVSAPQSLGLLPSTLLPYIEKICQSKKVIGIDIAELSPPHDVGGMTVHLAASLASRIIDVLIEN